MMSQELERYSEVQRDLLEQQLSNKQEINRRSGSGLTVIAYWHKQEDIVTIFLHDVRSNESSEFQVPNDEVMEWFNHPFSHPEAP